MSNQRDGIHKLYHPHIADQIPASAASVRDVPNKTLPVEAKVEPMKLALCMDKSEVFDMFTTQAPKVYGIPEDFFTKPVKLVDRKICETDPTLLQLIPYIVCQDENGMIFLYSRGKGGAEERLHAKMSVGLGGHVDRNIDLEENLYSLLQLEAARELKEEIDVDVDAAEIFFSGLIYEELTEVGRVHLGILSVVKLPAGFHISEEEGQIESGYFASLNHALSDDVYPRLEQWSQATVQHLISRIAETAVGGL